MSGRFGCWAVGTMFLAGLLSGCGGSSVAANDTCRVGSCADIPVDTYDPGNIFPDLGNPDIPVEDPGTADDRAFDVEAEVLECPGSFGCQCDSNDDCYSFFCLVTNVVEGISQCTKECLAGAECPSGWKCKSVTIGSDQYSICVPDVDPLCKLECLKDTDCSGLDNLCVAMEKSQFCLRGCADISECPADYDCVDATNLEGTVTKKQCVPLSGHCRCGVEIDYDTDEDHCGSCENKCEYAHGVPQCQEGKCALVGCETGWVNLNEALPDGDLDGCEYECTYKGPEDDPDAAYEDSNCDGIDGVLQTGIFVDPNVGEDADNTVGSVAEPFRTINAAMAFAANHATRKQIYVAKGQYSEQVTLVNGVGLYGGYDPAVGWKRDVKANVTQIMWDLADPGAVVAVLARDIIDKTVFDGFNVMAANAVESSASSYGMYVYHSSAGLVISNNRIQAGNGASGKSGSSGASGQNALGGASGSNGFEYGGFLGCDSASESNNQGGAGGQSPCANPGGKGGKGGSHNATGGNGETAANGGGTGGAGGTKSNGGAAGQAGKAGEAGKTGAGGKATGSLSPAGFWIAGNGGNGGDGIHGLGGGGGGGGGGDTTCCCDTMGGAGGGGGGGGCGGTGGLGGTGGGGSFGLFVVEASPTITGNTLISQSGGQGGNGGSGGVGGSGGPGGKGGVTTDDDEGLGGTGGSGGKGGDGGSGGGGAGGSTYSLFLLGSTSTPTCTGNTFEINGFKGGAGDGGSGSINKGEAGTSGQIFGATPLCSP